MNEKKETFEYKDFGVNIDEGNALVDSIKPIVKNTFTQNVLGGLGGFSGCFRMPSGFSNPILCAATDGVGSKLTLATQYNMLDNIGIDLVAMCANDLICDFARPLFFLDYYATHKITKEDSVKIIKSIANGCLIAKCSLIGGESAEMPSVYNNGVFDLAGFCVGIAEESDIKRRETISNGDVLIAISSSGFHSNGYSLLRGIIEKKSINVFERLNERTIIEELLLPTRIYVEHFLAIMKHIKGLAHITGGGLCENLIRILNDNNIARIDKRSIEILDIFKVFMPYVDDSELFRVFNMGVGMVVVADKNFVDSVISDIGKCGSKAYVIGHIESGNRQVILE